MESRKKEFTFVSLFCGCGGFDLGFIRERFRCVAAFDIDPLSVTVHRRNLRSPAEVCDLYSREFFFSPPTPPDVLLAGSPCQGFSIIGKRNFDDPRNQLLIHAGEIALKIKPRIFIVENVPGVKSGRQLIYWETLRNKLEGSGYQTSECCLEGTKMGLAQIRKRIFLLAWNSRQKIKISLQERKAKVLRDVLADIDSAPNHDINPLEASSNLAIVAKKIKPSQKLSNVRGGSRAVHTWDIPEIFGSTTKEEKEFLCQMMYIRRRRRIRDFGDADPIPKSYLKKKFGSSIEQMIRTLIKKGYIRKINGCYDLKHTFNGKYRRLSWDMPSPTVDTRFGNPRYFLHPQEDRGFTVREAARIQGFPDSFVFFGPLTSQFRMIGNAVPPQFGAYLATLSKDILLHTG